MYTILELSKLKMYDLCYNHIAPKYGCRTKMLYTKADSFIYQIKTRDLHRDLKKDCEHFDFSNYFKTLPLFNTAHLKVPNKMKDESCGVNLVEFVGHRHKVYSLKFSSLDRGKDIRKAKGIGRMAVAKMHQNYGLPLEFAESGADDVQRS